MNLELSAVQWHSNDLDVNDSSASKNELVPSVQTRHDFSDNPISVSREVEQLQLLLMEKLMV